MMLFGKNIILWRRAWLWMTLAVLAAFHCSAEVAVGAAGKTFFDVTAYGAVGDGKTDNSPAFQRAFSAAITAKRAAIRIPPGEYLLKSRVTAELAGDGLVIAGEGQGASVILCDNAVGAIRLQDKMCKAQVTLRDLSFYAVREGAGVAFELASPPRGVRNYRTFHAENVEIRGHGLPTRLYFNRGLAIINQWRPLFENIIFSGVLDPALNGDASDGSPFFRPDCGIIVDGCYAPRLRDCYVWNAHTGYRFITGGSGDGPEDGNFYRSFAVGCRVGMDIATPLQEPQLTIDSCHLNCRDVGIRIANRKFVWLLNNLMYCDQNQKHDDPEHPYTDILLTNVFAGVVSRNMFHTPSLENLRAEPPAYHTMIRVTGASRDLIISENVFNAKGLSVGCDTNVAGITCVNNALANRHTAAPKIPGAEGRALPAARSPVKNPAVSR